MGALHWLSEIEVWTFSWSASIFNTPPPLSLSLCLSDHLSPYYIAVCIRFLLQCPYVPQYVSNCVVCFVYTVTVLTRTDCQCVSAITAHRRYVLV